MPSCLKLLRARNLLAVFAAAPLSLAAQSAPAVQPWVLPTTAARPIFTSSALTIAGGAVLSPDGRWLAFSASRGAERTRLFVARVGTNQAIALTRGAGGEQSTAWFPDGKRLAFVADGSLRVVRFDPVRGVRKGEAVLVSRSVRAVPLDVSLEGQHVLYTTTGGQFAVVNASGGDPRVLAAISGIRTAPVFSSDGQSILYNLRPLDQSATGPIPHAIYQVPVSGGTPTVAYGPFGRGRIIVRSLDGVSARLIEPAADAILVLSFAHDTVGRVGVIPWGTPRFSPRGQGLTVTQSVLTSHVALVPTRGGGARVLDAPPESLWAQPYAWTTDGRRVLGVRAGDALTSVDVADGTHMAHAVVVPGTSQVDLDVDLYGTSPSGRYALVRRGRRVNPLLQFSQRDVPLFLYDSETRTARQLTSSFARVGAVGSGAAVPIPTTGVGEALVFAEHVADSVVLQLQVPTGAAARLLAWPFNAAARVCGIAVDSTRVAYSDTANNLSTLWVVPRAGQGQRSSHTTTGYVRELRWSPDGRWLAGIRLTDTPTGVRSELIRFPARGLTLGTPRVTPLSGRGSDLQWMPDSRALLLREPLGTGGAVLRMFSMTRGQRARALTGPMEATFQRYVLSPDGRRVALLIERQNGSTVYQFDFPGTAHPGR